MENQEIIPPIVSTLNDVKATYLWQYLTADTLKYWLISLMIVITFFGCLYFYGIIQLLKRLWPKDFFNSTETQKTPIPKTIRPLQEEITLPESLDYLVRFEKASTL